MMCRTVAAFVLWLINPNNQKYTLLLHYRYAYATERPFSLSEE
jgi:hypothetical protein